MIFTSRDESEVLGCKEEYKSTPVSASRVDDGVVHSERSPDVAADEA
jgi:hypothetical protein